MVVEEEVKKTHGLEVGLVDMAFANGSDLICLDKATQTCFGEKLDDVTQEKRARLYATRFFLTGKERYYVMRAKNRVQESTCSVQPKSELGDHLVEEQQKKKDRSQHLECDKSITLQPSKEDLNKEPQKAEATATITGQILLAVATLRDLDRNSIQAAATMLNAILRKERNKLRGKVPEIIEIIYFHLHAIQEPSAREAAIGAVCLLAEKNTEEVITSLLRFSLVCDRHVIQIWEALGQAKLPIRVQVLAKLLDVLKRRPCLHHEVYEWDKDDSSLLPLAATKALCIIFRDKKCKVPMNSFYVSVIIFLVIQLHYLVSYTDTEREQEDVFQTSDYIRCALEALKALIRREKTSHTCLTSLTASWDLLSSPENYLEGVLLLAKALVKHHRGLDYAIFTKVIPLLHHGDDKQKLTAMAFFTALLSSESTYAVLQKHYILDLLKHWQTDSSSTYRWLSLYGMGNLVYHLQNKKELMALISDILPSFSDPDEKVTLTAITAVNKIIAACRIGAKGHVKIATQLQPFLADGRNKICYAANKLFQDILLNLDVKDKSLMQDQVLTGIVTLMVNLQDPDPDVAKSRRQSLTRCTVFLGWTVDEEDSWDTTCKHLVKEHPGKLRTFLYQAQDYCQGPRKSSRSAATMFIDSIMEHVESSCTQKSEVDFLRRTFHSSQPEKQLPVPVVIESKKVCRFCPDLSRCSRYFPRSCI